jgi:protein TonB
MSSQLAVLNKKAAKINSVPLWIPLVGTLVLHAAFIGLGYWSVHDTLMEMITEGEVVAVAPVEPVVQEQEIELVDFTPPPPPEPEPEFIKPEEVVPPPPVPPKPKPKPETPKVEPVNAPREMAFAPSGVVVGNKNFPKPPYPYDAKLRRFQGVVIVSINVIGGKVVSAEVAKSSGYGVLDSSATSWIRQRWKFPENVTRTLSQPINFSLAE